MDREDLIQILALIVHERGVAILPYYPVVLVWDPTPTPTVGKIFCGFFIID